MRMIDLKVNGADSHDKSDSAHLCIKRNTGLARLLQAVFYRDFAAVAHHG